MILKIVSGSHTSFFQRLHGKHRAQLLQLNNPVYQEKAWSKVKQTIHTGTWLTTLILTHILIFNAGKKPGPVSTTTPPSVSGNYMVKSEPFKRQADTKKNIIFLLQFKEIYQIDWYEIMFFFYNNIR